MLEFHPLLHGDMYLIAAGVQNLVEAAEKYMSKPEPLSGDLVQIVTEEDLSNWTSYDDTLMDGQSESSMELLEDGTGCAITGNLVMDVCTGPELCKLVVLLMKMTDISVNMYPHRKQDFMAYTFY